jgi:UDP-glucuronate decarboxylase
VAGGAGFIGSHLCRSLLERGEHVICLDNLQTSRSSNLEMLTQYDNFEFVQADITAPLPSSIVSRTPPATCGAQRSE